MPVYPTGIHPALVNVQGLRSVSFPEFFERVRERERGFGGIEEGKLECIVVGLGQAKGEMS